MSRVSAAPRPKTATSVRITLTEIRMPPRLTPSFRLTQVSARSLRRVPQISARSGIAAIPTSVPTATGMSPPSSCPAFGAARKVSAVLVMRS